MTSSRGSGDGRPQGSPPVYSVRSYESIVRECDSADWVAYLACYHDGILRDFWKLGLRRDRLISARYPVRKHTRRQRRNQGRDSKIYHVLVEVRGIQIGRCASQNSFTSALTIVLSEEAKQELFHTSAGGVHLNREGHHRRKPHLCRLHDLSSGRSN